MSTKTIISILPHLQGGGVERLVSLLSEGLIKQKGCDVHIITVKPYEYDSFPVHTKISVHNLDLTQRTKWNTRLSNRARSKILNDYIKNNIAVSPDLIMCHQDTISKSFKYHDFDNVYHVIHTNLSEAKINRKTRWLSRLIAKVNLHLLYRNLKCISVSDGIRTDLQKSFKLENIKTIYNAVDVQQITTASQQSSHHPNGDYFIHVGNFTKAKRHDRLISAYQHSEIQTPLIMIGGESALSAAAARQIENLGLQKRALIHGFEANPYPWIANSKGLILASDFEGFGIVLAEAIALGVPIISTNCNSGPSEIVAGNSHCLADLTEESLSSKIRELDNDPDKFKVSLDKKFTLSCMVEEYYKLCE